jgi:hypothetical protein
MHDTPEIQALILHDYPDKCRAEYQRAFTAHETAIAEVTAAQARLTDARVGYAALGHQAASVGSVSAGDIIAAQTAVSDAEAGLVFCRGTVVKAEALKQAADNRLAAAHAESYRPVAQAGIEKRLQAAKRIEVAERELRRARADYDHGTALIHHALNRGVTMKLPQIGIMGIPGLPSEPSGAADEQRLWGVAA